MVPCPGTDTLSPRPAPRGLQVPAPGRWLWWLSPVGPSAKRQVAFSPGANRASLGPTHPCRAAQPQGWLCLFSSLQLPRLRVSGWGLNTDTYVSCPGGWTPRLGAPANSAPGLQTAAFSPRPHEVETERGRDRSSHKDTNPVTPLPWPHLTTVTSQKPLLQIPSFLGRSLGA